MNNWNKEKHDILIDFIFLTKPHTTRIDRVYGCSSHPPAWSWACRRTKVGGILRLVWKSKNTVYGLEQEAVWPMWLFYSWAISHLFCLFCVLYTPKITSSHWPCEDTTDITSGQKFDRFYYESIVFRQALDIAFCTTDISGLWPYLLLFATPSTRLSSANPWFPWLASILKSVLRAYDCWLYTSMPLLNGRLQKCLAFSTLIMENVLCLIRWWIP